MVGSIPPLSAYPCDLQIKMWGNGTARMRSILKLSRGTFWLDLLGRREKLRKVLSGVQCVVIRMSEGRHRLFRSIA